MTPKQLHKRIKIINGEKVFDDMLYLGYKEVKSLEPYNLSDVIVTDDFWCQFNDLTSLKGAPKKVGNDFRCYSNPLTSLEGLPEEIGGYIWIEKEVLHRLYLTNPLVALYSMQDKFIVI